MRHCNIPVFIPHLGCPNQCVFCNQRSISGCSAFCEDTVKEEIDRALSTVREGDRAEIAFFGGSFTGIDRDLMLRLLTLAETYVTAGCVTSIRLSTRPDYISEEILSLLSRFSVHTIELGLQSMDDAVLAASQRGHTAAEAAEASRAVVRAGFSLVGQMMIGLPGATPESEIMTAQALCALGVSAVRIYPTVVFYDTPLCDMTKRGDYIPLSIDEAVARTANVLEIFRERSIPTLRIGLCATEELASPERVMAGPNHPALGELVMSECTYRAMLRALQKAALDTKYVILHVPPREVSRAVGQHKRNLARLSEQTGVRVMRVLGDSEQASVYFTPWNG